jgi:uncharacterized membrane protein
MGPAIAVAGIVWGLARTATARVWWYAAIAAAFAMATPIVRAAHAVDALPIWLQWYSRPAGDFTIFTLFPWAGFVFAGGAVGVLIAAAKDEREERRLHAILGAIGVALVIVGFYTAARPSIYSYRASSFWTSSPTWFAIRLGILMMALTAIYACEVAFADATRKVAIDPLARFGRSSLFIYWIHVELVYGYASWMWRLRLPLWGTAIAFVLFSVLMYRAIGWRDRAVAWWRNRPRGTRTSAQTATA